MPGSFAITGKGLDGESFFRMNSKNFQFNFASGRKMSITFGMRMAAAFALFAAVLGTAGCIATRMSAGSTRPVDSCMEVYSQASIWQHMMDNICIFPFIAPPEMADASVGLTSAFTAKLVQRRPFPQIRALTYEVKSDSEALWYARNEGFTLLMLPELVYMMDGTGAMPTELVVRIRILDARTGGVLWDVKQEAKSEPGCDIDLTWNTATGEPAQRCSVLGDCLAQKFAEYLALPLEKKN